MPVHMPLAGRNSGGTAASVAASTGAKRSAFSTSTIAGEFSVRNTSAGEFSPSWTIWLAMTVSVPLRIVTGMPVSAVKASAQAWVSAACCEV